MNECQKNNDPNADEPPPFPPRARKTASAAAAAGARDSNDEPPPFPSSLDRKHVPVSASTSAGRSEEKPPPFPQKKKPAPAAGTRTVAASKNIHQRRVEEKPATTGALGPEQPQGMPQTRIVTSRCPPSGSPELRVTKSRSTGLRVVAIIGGCAIVLLGVTFAALLSGTFGRPSKSIEQDVSKAQDAFSRSKCRSFFQNMDRERLAVWKEAADKGMPEAEWLHGHVRLYGVECQEDPKEAMMWFRKAANQGNIPAMFSLGGCYQCGQSQDYAEAMKWYRKAADRGYAPAQVNLGQLYYDGLGVPEDHAEALKWYLMAAEQGYAPAQSCMGGLYYKDKDVPQDYKKMAKWFHKAAEQGYAPAQECLGECYEHGLGVRQDYTEMLNWYRKAADQENALAQFNLGNCYDNGRGMSQNHAEAVNWYRKAAKGGYAPAQDRLLAMGESTATNGGAVPASSSSITCEALVGRIANLGGSSDYQVAFVPQKPGYDRSYMLPRGMIARASIISAIGEPGFSYKVGDLGDEEWIYHRKDGSVCLELSWTRPGYYIIAMAHSRSR